MSDEMKGDPLGTGDRRLLPSPASDVNSCLSSVSIYTHQDWKRLTYNDEVGAQVKTMKQAKPPNIMTQ